MSFYEDNKEFAAKVFAESSKVTWNDVNESFLYKTAIYSFDGQFAAFVKVLGCNWEKNVIIHHPAMGEMLTNISNLRSFTL